MGKASLVSFLCSPCVAFFETLVCAQDTLHLRGWRGGLEDAFVGGWVCPVHGKC